MDLNNKLARWINPLKSRVESMIQKAIITAVDDSTKIQLVKIISMKGQESAFVERIQQAGFTSVPLEDSEAIIVSVGGLRDNLIVIGTDASEARPGGLAAGEVCIYNLKDPATKILLKDGEIQIKGPVKIDGDLTASGNINGAQVSAGIGGAAVKLSTHIHTSAAPGSPTTPPTPGT